MNRFVIYARYSSDLQSAASIEDQKRKCREFASREGYVEVRSYDDFAVSGSGLDRANLQRLLADCANPARDFDLVLLDDTSRLSRSLADVIALHQQFHHFGLRVVAVSQGIDSLHEQSDLLIAMHGITDSLYVKELAKKTHRGLEGRFLKGLSAGGRCYGYSSVIKDDGHGWIINEEEAAVVRGIFELSASGFSLKKIAGVLNSQKTPPPQKRAGRPHPTWCPTAIREMLRREIYIGRRVWNKTKFVKRPGTNKRVARPRPQREWQVQEVPELRIISPELWAAVHDRQLKLKQIYAPAGKPVNRAASSKYLLSGFLRCGVCDAKMNIVSGTGKTARYGCPQAWNRSACANRISIRSSDLEVELLKQLKDELTQTEAVDYAIRQLLKAQEQQPRIADDRKRIEELKRQIDHLIAAIAATGHSDSLIASLQSREREREELERRQIPKRKYGPEDLKQIVLKALDDIPGLLAKAPEAAKTEMARHVGAIRLVPSDGNSYWLEGDWDLLGNGDPVLVAGARFELATFGL